MIIVTTADSIVILIKMHKPIFVDRFICSFQNAATGTIASTKSVSAVYAQNQYEKLFNTFGLQHVPGMVFSQSFFVGVHCANARITVIIAKAIWRTAIPYKSRVLRGLGSRS